MEPNALLRTLTDKALVRAIAGGSDGAFGELRTRHHNRIWKQANRLVEDPGHARAAADDTFLRARSRATGYRGEDAVDVWLQAICRGLCLERRPEDPAGRDRSRHSLGGRR